MTRNQIEAQMEDCSQSHDFTPCQPHGLTRDRPSVSAPPPVDPKSPSSSAATRTNPSMQSNRTRTQSHQQPPTSSRALSIGDKDKPQLRVSESGKIQSEHYRTQLASHAIGILKRRAFATQNSHGNKSGSYEQISPLDIALEGYLIKQGSYWKTWKKRYFILRKDSCVLAYYASEKNLTKLGEIEIERNTRAFPIDENTLDKRSSTISPHRSNEMKKNREKPHRKNPEWRFQVTTASRVLTLKTDDEYGEDERNKWIQAINEVAEHHKNTIAGPTQPYRQPAKATATVKISTSPTKAKYESKDQHTTYSTSPEKMHPHDNNRNRLLGEVKCQSENIIYARLKNASSQNLLAQSSMTIANTRHNSIQKLKNSKEQSRLSFSLPHARKRKTRRSMSTGTLEIKSLLKSGMLYDNRHSKKVPEFELDASNDPLENRKRLKHAKNLSLPQIKPPPSKEFAVSIGMKGRPTPDGMVVVLSELCEKQTYQELGRSEMQNNQLVRSCGGEYFVRDFSTLLSIPIFTENLLRFSVYNSNNSSSEELDPKDSMGYIFVASEDLLFSEEGTLVTNLHHSEQKLFLVIERVQTNPSINLSHGFTYATKNFLLDTVQDSTNSISGTGTQGDSSSTSAKDNSIKIPSSKQILVSEELAASYFSLSVPIEYLKMMKSCYAGEIDEVIHKLTQIGQHEHTRNPHEAHHGDTNVRLSHMYANTSKQGTSRLQSYQDLYNQYDACCSLYMQLYQALEDHQEQGITGSLKRSTDKKDGKLRFVPTNLNTYIMRVREIHDAAPEGSHDLSSKADTEFVDVITTHGCPAAHYLGFKDGGLSRINLSKPPSDGDISSFMAKLEHRRDIVYCQMLSILLTSFMNIVSLACEGSEHHIAQLKLISECGFLLSMESLLSTMGSEKGMIEDMWDAVEWVNSNVRIQLVLLMETKAPQLARCVDITSSSNRKHVLVNCGVPKELFEKLPSKMQQGHAVQVSAVVFTQGINEMQTVANTVLDTSLQDRVNISSLKVLSGYLNKSKAFIKATDPEGLQQCEEMLQRLKKTLKIETEEDLTVSKRSYQKKNVNILIESSELCRLLGAGRTTCCKSGKDRTAMSSTLEFSRVLVENFSVKQGISFCDILRERGVRRENVFANTGLRKYAFNTFQLKYLPDCYRPPAFVADAHTSS